MDHHKKWWHRSVVKICHINYVTIRWQNFFKKIYKKLASELVPTWVHPAWGGECARKAWPHMGCRWLGRWGWSVRDGDGSRSPDSGWSGTEWAAVGRMRVLLHKGHQSLQNGWCVLEKVVNASTFKEQVSRGEEFKRL